MTSESAAVRQVRVGSLTGLGVPEALCSVDSLVRDDLAVLANLASQQIEEWSEASVRKRLLHRQQHELYGGQEERKLSGDELSYRRGLAMSDDEIKRHCLPGVRLVDAIGEYSTFLCLPGPLGNREEELASMSAPVAAFVLILTWLAHDQDAHLAAPIGLDIQYCPWERFGEFIGAHEESVVAALGSFHDQVARDPSLSPGHWREPACKNVQREEWLRAVEVAISVIEQHEARRSTAAAAPGGETDVPSKLTHLQRRALKIIKESSGISGKSLAGKLGCSESYLRSSIVPALKKGYGVHCPGRGYHYEQELDRSAEGLRA